MSEDLFRSLIEKIDTISNSVSELKSEVRGEKRKSSTEINETVTKRLKQNELPEFRRSYNKDQFKHNNEVKQALSGVEEAINEDDIYTAKKKDS